MDSLSKPNPFEFSIWDLLLLAAFVIGVILLYRAIKAYGRAPVASIANAAAVPFSPWFPVR